MLHDEEVKKVAERERRASMGLPPEREKGGLRRVGRRVKGWLSRHDVGTSSSAGFRM